MSLPLHLSSQKFHGISVHELRVHCEVVVVMIVDC